MLRSSEIMTSEDEGSTIIRNFGLLCRRHFIPEDYDIYLCILVYLLTWSRYGSAGIATRYGLELPWIKSRWGRDFFHTRPDRSWGPPSLLYDGYQFSLPVLKRPGRGVDSPPHLAQRLKKEWSHTFTPPLGLSGLF
jgi:hypothetical protein